MVKQLNLLLSVILGIILAACNSGGGGNGSSSNYVANYACSESSSISATSPSSLVPGLPSSTTSYDNTKGQIQIAYKEILDSQFVNYWPLNLKDPQYSFLKTDNACAASSSNDGSTVFPNTYMIFRNCSGFISDSGEKVFQAEYVIKSISDGKNLQTGNFQFGCK